MTDSQRTFTASPSSAIPGSGLDHTEDDKSDSPGRPTRTQRAMRRQESAVAVALIGFFLIFSAAKPHNFLTAGNLANLANDASILLVLSVGITFATVMGLFDLSIGSVLVFSEVLAVKLMGSLGGQSITTIVLGAAVAVASGVLWGLLNGLLVARLGLSPFIVTLATLGAALGAAELIADGTDETSVPPNLTQFIAIDKLAGVPTMVIIAGLIALIGGVILAKTRFGLLTYAIGSHREAARRSGVNVQRHIIAVYAAVGALAGTAGFLDQAQFATTSIGGHSYDALAAITAVALGGASLYGGSGTMLGTVIGVSIPAVLQNGLVILGTQTYWYQIIVAAALIASVTLDRRRRAAAHIA